MEMSFKLNNEPGLWKVGGWLIRPIQYEVRIADGNWSPYFGEYQNQRWGNYDTESCWAVSGINCVEDQLEWLMKNNQFTPEAILFFKNNGYIDQDGNFSLSERYIEICAGQRNGGGSAPLFWQTAQKVGLLPRADLNYSDEKANSFNVYSEFLNDYFNPGAVTIDMRLKAKNFLSHVNIAYQQIGSLWETPEPQILLAALRQAPLQIGLPVPKNPQQNWNQPFVQYDGGKTPQHEVELTGLTVTNNQIVGGYPIFDQYEPHIKVLSKDYYIPFVHQGIVTAIDQNSPNPVVQNALWDQIWTAVINWFNNIHT